MYIYFLTDKMRCLVVFCKNKGNSPGMTYFMLTSRRHDSWMRALGRDPTKEHLTDKNCICHVHFREEDKYVVNNKIRLRPDAIPRLNLRKPFLPTFQTINRSISQPHGVIVISKPEIQSVELVPETSLQQPDKYLPGHTPSSSRTEDITNSPTKKINHGSKAFCRMCLEPIVERKRMVPLALMDTSFAAESATFKQKKTLETFKITNMIHIVMPNFDFKVAYNPIACHKCVARLESAYKFIAECQENEEIIQLYKSNHCPNVELVSCEDVAQNQSLLMEERKTKTSKTQGSLLEQSGCQLEQSGSQLELSGSQLEQRGNIGLASDISQAGRHEILNTSSSASQENLAAETSMELCSSIKCETGDYGGYGGDSNFLLKTEEMSCTVKEEIIVKEDDTPNNERIAQLDYCVKDEYCSQPDTLSMNDIGDYY